MDEKFNVARRDFFKQAAGAIASTSSLSGWSSAEIPNEVTRSSDNANTSAQSVNEIKFPRVFKGEQLKMIAFPLGGVTAGSIALGGRGQLKDWEIYNRPNKGFSPSYAFPAIWAQAGNAPAVAKVLEARILPPFAGENGLGSDNVPGLSRLASAEFTGQYPLAKIKFDDPHLPVLVQMEAFSPFIPLEPDDSGLPVAVLRYRIHNPGRVTAKVAIAYSLDNPVASKEDSSKYDTRLNQHREENGVAGLFMTNPGIDSKDPAFGSFALTFLSKQDAQFTSWKGWPKSKWWNAPMLFWDTFSREGALFNQPAAAGLVGAICQQTSIEPGSYADFTFLLAWHFPNRTPAWCGWESPHGEADTIIGSYHCTRFKDAWEVATYTAVNLNRLESKTLLFVNTFAESTLPDVIKEAASANLSTLASTTCFRTADGAFHGFEGSDDKWGCCFGNCTHVWNYETVTAFLFPTFAHSLREAAFGYSMDPQGGMRFRQLLPDGKERYKIAAADGQMGQILHAYLDWKLTGDKAWLLQIWPKVKKGMEFAWITGGWDPEKRGVFDGVQHTTYDVEFYGPNPLGGIYYLGALRAAEEMAKAVGDDNDASTYHSLFLKGSRWIDSNLFQGEFYLQKIRGYPKDQIAPQLISGFGSENTEQPEYQVGGGCLVDQLLGQYLADVCGLGPIVSKQNIRTTLESIYRYNYKRTLIEHNTVQRTYALNDEAAVVVCDYGKSTRPAIPFPYFAEAWTGLEYSVAAMMFFHEMVPQGIEYIQNVRSRYDGIKRNPWDEPECGHHYARAMSSWTSIVALSGFEYDAPSSSIKIMPRYAHPDFKCFWSTGSAWGSFTCVSASISISVLAGKLPCRSISTANTGLSSVVKVGGKTCPHKLKTQGGTTLLTLDQEVNLEEGNRLTLELLP